MAAALKAARQAYSGPIVAIVQPHRYTRLRDTFEQFCTCLNDADVAIIAPVYAAGEQPIPGFDRDTYAEALRAHGHRNVLVIDGAGGSAGAVADLRETRRRGRLPRRRLDHAMGGRSRSRAEANRRRARDGRSASATRCPKCAALMPTTRRSRILSGSARAVRRKFCSARPMPTICARSSRASRTDCPSQSSASARIFWCATAAFRGVVDPSAGELRPRRRSKVHAFALARRRSTAAVARAAADAGVAGLEFLRGVPGTIGGALRMNAGCYGREIKDIFVEATAIDAQGRKLRARRRATWGSSIANPAVPDDLVFVEAVFAGTKDDPAAIRARMNALVEQREASQPVKSRTGGSTFKNPDAALSGGAKPGS